MKKKECGIIDPAMIDHLQYLYLANILSEAMPSATWLKCKELARGILDEMNQVRDLFDL